MWIHIGRTSLTVCLVSTWLIFMSISNKNDYRCLCYREVKVSPVASMVQNVDTSICSNAHHTLNGEDSPLCQVFVTLFWRDEVVFSPRVEMGSWPTASMWQDSENNLITLISFFTTRREGEKAGTHSIGTHWQGALFIFSDDMYRISGEGEPSLLH